MNKLSLTCVFKLSEISDEAFVLTLYRQLMKFNSRSSKREYDGHTIEVQLLGADEVTVLGGLLGATSYGYLHIDAVFVPDSLRGSGIGRELILIAEEEARKRSCTGAWLDTFSFSGAGLLREARVRATW